jgi:hypothetical protein
VQERGWREPGVHRAALPRAHGVAGVVIRNRSRKTLLGPAIGTWNIKLRISCPRLSAAAAAAGQGYVADYASGEPNKRACSPCLTTIPACAVLYPPLRTHANSQRDCTLIATISALSSVSIATSCCASSSSSTARSSTFVSGSDFHSWSVAAAAPASAIASLISRSTAALRWSSPRGNPGTHATNPVAVRSSAAPDYRAANRA